MSIPLTSRRLLGIIAIVLSPGMLLTSVVASEAKRAIEPTSNPPTVPVAQPQSETSEQSHVVGEPISSAPPPTSAAPEAAQAPVAVLTSTLTFYDCEVQDFCGAMANGEDVYEGAAACSYDLAMGTMFTIPGDPTGRVYVCKDRGLLPNTHVDIFWYHPGDGWQWQAAVGSRGAIKIVEPPGT